MKVERNSFAGETINSRTKLSSKKVIHKTRKACTLKRTSTGGNTMAEDSPKLRLAEQTGNKVVKKDFSSPINYRARINLACRTIND